MLDGTVRSESFAAALDEADHVDGLDSRLKHEQQDISNMADFWEAQEISFRGGNQLQNDSHDMTLTENWQWFPSELLKRGRDLDFAKLQSFNT
jgi:hypothetical protein